jgi:hypothetical protein
MNIDMALTFKIDTEAMPDPRLFLELKWVNHAKYF